MEIQARSSDRNLLLLVSGELDHHGAKCAIQEVEQAMDAALPRKTVLDFSGITFMDSSGIAVLLRARRRLDELEGRLVVRSIPTQPRKVLDAAGVGRIISLQ